MIMESQTKKQSVRNPMKYILTVCLCIMCVAGVLSIAGCSAPEESSSQQTEAAVTGVITSLGSTELLVEASEDTNGFLQGQVRVDISQINSSIVQGLMVGDTITVTYSGQVAMSAPPLISATTLGVVR